MLFRYALSALITDARPANEDKERAMDLKLSNALGTRFDTLDDLLAGRCGPHTTSLDQVVERARGAAGT